MKIKFKKTKFFKPSLVLALAIFGIGLNACSKLQTTKCPSNNTIITNVEHFTPPGAKVQVVAEKPLNNKRPL